MVWGYNALIDLYNCDADLIKDHQKIKEFVSEICKVIDMKPYKDTMVERFGDGDLYGNSFIQFIETSTIIGHFDETQNRAFIDIFSCKNFDSHKAEEFSKQFFKATSSRLLFLERK